MTPVEIIALILVIVGAIKIIALLVKPSAWANTAGKLWRDSSVFTVVALIICLVVLRYLLTELTIVQIFAVFGFVAPFYWIALAPYRKELFELVTRDLSVSSVVRKSWLTLIIWLVLMIWVLKELF